MSLKMTLNELNLKEIDNELQIINGSYDEYFFKMYDCWNEYDLKQSDKIILSCIDYSCRLNNNKCNWSNEAFISNTGLARSKVIESLNTLETHNIIKKSNKDNKRIITFNKKFKREGTFLKLYVNVLRIKDLSINDKIIYSVIHTYTNNKDYKNKCYANNTMIKNRASCSSLNTVSNSLKKLEKLKLIKIIQNEDKRELTIVKDLWVVHNSFE